MLTRREINQLAFISSSIAGTPSLVREFINICKINASSELELQLNQFLQQLHCISKPFDKELLIISAQKLKNDFGKILLAALKPQPRMF